MARGPNRKPMANPTSPRGLHAGANGLSTASVAGSARQIHVDLAAAVAADDDVVPAVAVEIADCDVVGAVAHFEIAPRAEAALAVAAREQYGSLVLVADGEVDVAVAVEVAG